MRNKSPKDSSHISQPPSSLPGEADSSIDSPLGCEKNDQLLTVSETADLLRLKSASVYHLVSRKKIPVIKLSARCIRFSRNSLLKWVASLSHEPESR